MAKLKTEKPEIGAKVDGEGWTDTGLGELPPFTHLDVGDSLQGKLINARASSQPEQKKKGKKVEQRPKINLEIELTKAGTFSQGSTRKKTVKRVELEAGKVIAFAIGGNLSTLLQDAVMKLTGNALGEDSDLDAKFLMPLQGKEIRIDRHEDGEIKTGPWKGNPVKRYSLKYR